MKKSNLLIALAGALTVATMAQAETMMTNSKTQQCMEMKDGKCVKASKTTEGKCGEGKCGSAMPVQTKAAEGKCGEGKCGANH
ncbi:hypothetical protein ACFQ02_07325 [Seminibacterium arietis]|uniref:Low-complexity protein n=1 Tax=Seminibacterium arietis TaxID=1173502 RepID=A0ABW3IAW6_9PAST